MTSSATVVTDLLRHRCALHPDQVALNINGDTELSFAEWERRANAVAHGLLRAGVHKGDTIALLFGGMEWIEYAIAYLAVLNAGGTAVHLGDAMDPSEIRRRLRETSASRVLHGSLTNVPVEVDLPRARVGALDSGEHSPVPVRLEPTDIADILYTSGTTGAAKALTNPHGNLVFGRGPEGLRQFGAAAPMLAPMPMGSTSSAATASIIAVASPAKVVISPVSDVQRMAELIAEEGVGFVMLTPWIAQRMIAERIDEKHELGSVTRVASASAPLPPAVSRRLLELFPSAELHTAYSQSEAVPAVIINMFDPERPTTLGKPATGTEVRIADTDGAPLPPGERGEIWLRSAALKRFYLDADRNAKAHVDGWIRTGDVGHVDSDGYAYLFDRHDDIIEVGLEQVSSIEVEAALYEHPALREAAVVGVPDPQHDHAVAAFVVLDQPRRLPELTIFAAGQLRPPMLPTQWHLVTELPRGITGKVLKGRLRERLRQS